MNKQLISEISRIHNIMGILNESTTPIINLTDDIVKGIKNVLKPKGVVGKIKSVSNPVDTILADDIEELSKVAAGTKTITNDQLKNIVKRLIKNKNVEEYLVPKIIKSNTDLQNYIKDYQSSIRQLKSRGGKLQDAFNDIDIFMNRRSPTTGRPYLQTELPEMRAYIRKEFRDFAQKEFNPQISKEITKTAGEKFKQGWKMGKDSKKGGQLTLKAGGLMFKNLFTKKVSRLSLPPEEKDLVTKYLLTGIPDWPMLGNAWRSFGGIGAAGNALRQLWQKFKFLFLAEAVINILGDLFYDVAHKGEEITDEQMGELSKWTHRFLRSFEIPSLGVVSPAGWVTGLLTYSLYKLGGGGLEKSQQAFITYLKNSDENLYWWKGFRIGKEWFDKWYLASKGLRETIDGEIVKTKAGDSSKSEIEKAAGVDLSDKKSNVPDEDINKSWTK